ncbi:MAG: hypothetical protein EPO42_07295 [Gallionellaceae bacterium]|nr:MAG: hypothetical protein EPO42_07295 [Gallionellaceae bacterium]
MKLANKVLARTVLMALPAFAGTASAVELYNEAGILATLKKNSVVSERDLQAIKNEFPRMEIKGGVQFQYVNAAGDAVAKKVNEFDLRRANLSLSGRISEKVSVVIEPEYGKGLPSIRDAYIAFRGPIVGAFAGNHRVPFGAEALQNDMNLRFVERSMTSQISPGRMVGVSALASLPDNKLMAQAGVWNTNINSKSEAGLINDKLSDNQIFSTLTGNGGDGIMVPAFRLGYSTVGREDFYGRSGGVEDDGFNAAVGFSYYSSSPATNNVTTVAVTALNGAKAFAGDASLKFGRFSGDVEYASRSLDWWQLNALTNTSAIVSSAQTSYAIGVSANVIEGLSLAARMESFVYDGTGKVLKGMYGQDQDKWTTLGVNYFSKESNTKVQLNYIQKQEVMSVGAAPNNNTLQVQVSSFF